MTSRLIRHACLAAALLLSFPALAQRIVFESTRDGNFEIYSMNADGTGVTNLTQHPALDRLPQWSPDGTKIAFVSERDGNQEVYVMDADGSNKVNLTQSELGVSDANAQWSPDGSIIAYNSNRDGSQQIHVMNADGTSQLRKTTEGGGVLSDARWSPSGSHIAYVASRAQKRSIIVMDTVSFDQKENLTLDLDSADNPRWSPDSQRIVFHAGPDGASDVYVMNLDGSGKVNLTNHPANDGLARWSPDGTRILFVSNRDGNEEVYAMNTDGSGLLNLSNSSASGEGFPQWSPEGSRVAFASNRDGGDLELYIVKADGSDLTRLTNTAGSDFNPELFGNFSFGQPPAIFAGGVVLANLAPKVATISPLSIISIFGMDFTSDTLLFPNLKNDRIDTILGGTCVEIGGERAPIFAVTPTQANVQTPATPVTGPVGVVVIRDCDTPLATHSNVEMVTLEEATPGFFIFNPIASHGFIAARFNATESQQPAPVAPESSFPNDSFGPSRPARPGDIILLYGTGWGPTEAALITGELAPEVGGEVLDSNPMVTLDGIPLAPSDVFYVGVTPFTAGLFQLAIRIPEGTPPGNHQVLLTVYSKTTPIGPVIPVAAP